MEEEEEAEEEEEDEEGRREMESWTNVSHRLVSPVLAACLQSWKAEAVVHTVLPPGMVAAGFVLGEDEM